MPIEQLFFLLPCRSMDDLSLERDNDQSEQILSAWTALYHPALIALAGSAPQWGAAEEPPSEPGASLIVVPPCCEALLPAGWVDEATAAGGQLIRQLRRRGEILAAACRLAQVEPAAIDAEWVADFHALGFAQFLIEMMTRQLRYMSSIDDVSFRAAALAAAKAAVAGDEAEMRRELESAFSALYQSREYFYPVESHLIDLTLVASTTIGESLRRQLDGPTPVNLLLSAGVLEEIARREPQTLAQLKQAIEKGTAAIVGGERDELPLPLMPLEAVRDGLVRGLAVYRQHLGVAPKVFGRRRYGLSPLLPQALLACGLSGALHSTLDDGKFPASGQSRLQWAGLDGAGIEAIGKVPFDVSQSQSFLRLPERLGNSMDSDHVATIVFAHWPGQTSPWYEDLRRIARYTTTVGTFTTVDAYFTQTGVSGYRIEHKPDEYRSPYLRQAVDAKLKDPISRWAAYYRARAALAAAGAVNLMAAVAGANLPVGEDDLDHWAEAIDLAVEHDPANLADVQRAVMQATDAALRPLAAALGRASSPTEGFLVVNPCSFARRTFVDVSSLAMLPDQESPVVVNGQTSDRKEVLVEAPAMGFAWVGAGQHTSAPPPRRGWLFGRKETIEKPVADDNVLHNEFFRVVIDRTSGGIRAVLDDGTRGPRLAQQIALRWPEGDEHDPGHESHYTLMIADEVRVSSRGPLVGEIASRGRLIDRQGQRRAGFKQVTRVVRGSRLIELDIELDGADAVEGNPWHSYYAARFAWGNESASLRRGLHGVSVATDANLIDAPEFIELQDGNSRTVLLPGGLPYHRRLGYRRLDTLLVVPGETQRRFRLGIGIDCPNAAATAIDFLTPPSVVPSARPEVSHAWLFHLETRGVVATRWQPLTEGDRLIGVRVRLLETEGRNVRFGLHVPRTLALAARIGPNDSRTELPIEADRAEVEIANFGWVELELRFA